MPDGGCEPLGGAGTQSEAGRRVEPLENLLVVADVQHADRVLKLQRWGLKEDLPLG